jgi:hypothetical protein
METRQRVKGGWSRGERVGFGGGTSTPVEEAGAAPASGGFGGWCEAVTLRKKRISEGRRKRVFVLTKNGGTLYYTTADTRLHQRAENSVAGGNYI